MLLYCGKKKNVYCFKPNSIQETLCLGFIADSGIDKLERY